MFDEMYTDLIKRADYKKLMLVPVILSGILLLVILLNGFNYGIDFKGGTWIELPYDKDKVSFGSDFDEKLESDLATLNLEDLNVIVDNNIEVILITTTSTVDREEITGILEKSTGIQITTSQASGFLLREAPVISASELEQKLLEREDLGLVTGVSYKDETGGTAVYVNGEALEADVIERALFLYLGQEAQVIETSESDIFFSQIEPTVGEDFFTKAILAIIAGFILMIIIVFIAFYDPIPSGAVVLAAACDILIALGGMSIFGVQLELASVAALLMLIGYSVDSDIMLTSRVLKSREGTVDERLNNAMKTGLTMTLTTVGALIVLFLVATYVHIDELANIAAVLLMGLIGDLMTTWFTNAGILKTYVESKKHKKLFKFKKFKFSLFSK